jgi:ribose 5-phosphate isomerase
MITLKNIDVAALEKALLRELAVQANQATAINPAPLLDDLNEIQERLTEFLAASHRTTEALGDLRQKVSNMIHILDVRLDEADEVDEEEAA